MINYTLTGLPKIERRPIPAELQRFTQLEGGVTQDVVLPVLVDDVLQAGTAIDQHPSGTGKVPCGTGSLLLQITGTRPEWQEEALCAQSDPEAFFPEKGGSTREAKRICGRCAVKSECLEYALSREERWGIWGGLSERERRRLKRRAA